ncbi:flagellar motor stator protein MotA [Varunaivibrio sulfuroxidans]|uniref:Chemotaxis protein MotA n=1 Tax=Varunaivibrio sulfuroxidans TaxID=1773489 RepID=A0A4R3JED6_9PROT|nr:flagellar motor stator protein MotA [Varunaivibrio sulfuroxidans]TCS64242.1 chemotaxis protein MotA [Varunaivibrio sulfuroxidans]WES31317.1 flagellar motor stator protein MotA [Varunaivibrio sulfuroxidans]
MLFIVGIVVVIGAVIGGFMGAGGHLVVLWQPLEFVIIFGAAIGAFLISNPKSVITGTLKSLGKLIKGPKYGRDDYMELLSVLYTVFKLAKSKGDLALESHVENPDDSSIFQQYPGFHSDHHAVEFLCDYLRMLTLGTSNPHEVGDIMDLELESHHEEHHNITSAVTTLADGTPALGIVAAVLGIIHTMGSITEPPEILGHLIGAALVGTFSGILFSYGFFGPMAGSLTHTFNSESQYLTCIRAGIIAHMQGYAPQVSIEFARKTLGSDVRPTFAELEDSVQNAGDAG